MEEQRKELRYSRKCGTRGDTGVTTLWNNRAIRVQGGEEPEYIIAKERAVGMIRLED